MLATERDGFLDQAPEQGLFVDQTRVLSSYCYFINGVRPRPVTLSNVEQHSWMGYYIISPPGMRDGRATLVAPENAAQQSIELRLSRYISGGMHEDVDLSNFTQQPVSLDLEVLPDADFADQEESKGERKQRGAQKCEWSEGDHEWRLTFEYHVEHRYDHQGEAGIASVTRGLTLRIVNATSAPSYDARARRVKFRVELAGGGTWRACFNFIPLIDGQFLVPEYRCRAFSGEHNEQDRRRLMFLKEATQFSSPESATLTTTVIEALERGKRDLAALRLYSYDHGTRAWTVAAGLPMYVALFGRDTLTAAWEAAPLGLEVMCGTLQELMRWQGTRVNDWRDEQPGRMLHEAHTGPLEVLNFNPKARYYGSVTTSAFYPFVVAQLWHWTGDRARVAPFLGPAIQALKWLDSCDLDGDRLCEYQTRSTQGVENQAWKDSGDAIVYEDGSQVPKPIATCEEQGIAYAAKMNLAEVLWWFDRKSEARQLYREAKELKRQFNEAFWMEREQFLAMALDREKRQVRSIGSNALHCLATGIVEKTFIEPIMERLFRADLFSGWGIRTLSSEHPAYNPYSYHRGTVWPVEHGPFAVAAYRYGFHDRVEQICRSQFELAALFDFCRLPECVSGHPRDEEHPFPAIYPAANSPQAWSATTVYTLLQCLLGLQPFAPLRMLFVDPYLPSWLPEITLEGLRVADAVVTIRFFRRDGDRSDYEIREQRGRLHVIRQPSPWSLTADFPERTRDILVSLLPGK